MSDVTLSSATRSNLLSLQRTTDLISQTQDRLSTGRKVNSAIDDALSFFKSRALGDRASDLATIKNNIVEGINVVETAVKSLESMEDTLKQMKAIAESAKAESSASERRALSTQFNTMMAQLNHMASDAEYNGVNLLIGTQQKLKVVFSEESDARVLTVGGQLLNNTAAAGTVGLGIHYGVCLGSFANVTTSDGSTGVNRTLTQIDGALDKVRSAAREFGTNAALMEIRKEFTENIVNTLETGASQLVNADMNAESANMLSLQTRQQLGTISLSIAQQSEQAVLRLF
ncbi:flagellin [Roseospira visakhapatnamensis]|uniref:Flagellin n=1 Tax=Roseospira visakhapatnamensis TaxID=390880 RepID=A0A7W6RCZ9_9PROT|nr:flagellin [Roseospira visakhapatnamensis]MBB4266198.1 flagellin-like hook-associated protein FlgL [Roseospira visakhapatnamensis]